MADVLMDAAKTDTARAASVGYEALRHGCALVAYKGAGLLKISGSGAADLLGRISTRSIDFLLEGQISSALLLAENGTIVAEVLIYCLGTEYLVEIWPAQAEAGRAHLVNEAKNYEGLTVEDLSEAYAILGVEGPESFRIAQKFLLFPVASMAFRSFAVPEGSSDLAMARIGVTGEYGYKFLLPTAEVGERRRELIAQGACPADEDAVNVCRMETRFANVEAESGGAAVTPFDLGLQWMVDFQHEFTGKEALLAYWGDKPGRVPVCWTADENAGTPPANGAVLRINATDVGTVCHAEFSPSLQRVIGTAQVDASVAAPGLEFELSVSAVTVRTISAPFLVATSMSTPLE